jgi:hypothetical protein
MRKKVGGIAGFFGYDLDEATTVTPLTVEGSPRVKTLTGTELGRRRDAFAHLAQLDEPMTPWFGNRMLTPEAIGVVAPKQKRNTKKAAAPPPPPTMSKKVRKVVGRVVRRVRPAPPK